MPSLKNTGHGATITFGTQSLAYFWRKIGAVQQAREKVEANYLGIVAIGSNPPYAQNLPGDLTDPGEFEIEYAFDSANGQPAMTDPETITITLPMDSTQSSAYNVAGTGYVLERTVFPECATNGLQIGKMRIAFNGLTGPTPTVGS
jgi:hypothetical protein